MGSTFPDFKPTSKDGVCALLVEFWGTTLICLFIASIPSNTSELLLALPYGLVSFLFARYSGGHFNPVLSIVSTCARQMNPVALVLYVGMQMVGGIAGFGLWRAFTNRDATVTKINMIVSTSYGDKEGEVFGLELMATYVMVLVWLYLIDQDSNPLGRIYSMNFPISYFFFSLAYAIGFLLTGQFDRGCLNPARAFGASAVVNEWDNHWVFWVGPIIGGLGAFLTFEALRVISPTASNNKVSP